MTPRDPHPWISKYIFPGGYTPSLSELAKPIEKSNLIIADMEVLRMHYAHTLRNWKSRFLGKKEEVLKMFDERFFRMWEFYLAGCEMAFKWGDQVVFQFQLSKKLLSTPNTRDYIY
jgi:cyclopropane-fatty-acyl-phospholipid synthase